MRVRKRIHRVIVIYRKHYRSRLLRMPKENLRGAVRGSTSRYRRFLPCPAKRVLGRRIERLLALYQLRFGQDDFVRDITKKCFEPSARNNWLPGGFAHWRVRLKVAQMWKPGA